MQAVPCEASRARARVGFAMLCRKQTQHSSLGEWDALLESDGGVGPRASLVRCYV